jgi:hypothetical protein
MYIVRSKTIIRLDLPGDVCFGRGWSAYIRKQYLHNLGIEFWSLLIVV